MQRHIRDFHVASECKFKLNNDLSCSDNKKNDRHLQTVCMFYAITSLLVKFRKRLHMVFEDDTSVEKTAVTAVTTSRKFYLNLVHFKEYFVREETSKLNCFSLACLTKKFAYGFDLMLLEPALCQVWNGTDGSKWSQNATLDFYTLQFLFRSESRMTIARAHFEIPARDKTDPILNNYLTQAREKNARSGVRRAQNASRKSFIFIFLTVVQIWKTCVVF